MSNQQKLQFKFIRAKNFRSISNTPMELLYESHPTTLVTSTDNGAGKSTLLVHALYYVLFDRAYEPDCKKTALVNSRNNKDCLVEVGFETKGHYWTVRRGMKPSVFDIEKDGVRVEDEAAKKDYQAFLLGILGFDHKLFSTSVALGVAQFVPFASMPAADRRNFVEQMLDMIVFSHMNEITKARIKANNLAKTDTDYKINNAETSWFNSKRIIDMLNETIARKSADTKGQIDSIMESARDVAVTKKGYQAQIESKRTEMLSARETLVTIGEHRATQVEKAKSIKAAFVSAKDSERAAILQRKAAGLASVADVQAKLTAYPSDLATQRDKAVKLIAQFETKINIDTKTRDDFLALDNCPTCRQLVAQETKDHRCAELNPSIDKLSGGLEQLKEKLNAIDLQIKEVTELNSQVTDLNRAVSAIDLEITKFDAAVREQSNLQTPEQDAAIQADDNDTQAHTQVVRLLESEINGLERQVQSADTNIRTFQSQIEQIKKQAEDAGEATKLASEQATLAGLDSELQTLKDKATELLKGSVDLADVLVLLKDDGVKAHIVKQYLPFLNQKINEYLEKMGMFISFTLDEDYNVTMFAPDRKGQTLGNLSTGQLRRVDLSVLLAWRDVARLKASVDTNLLILDEILENLSEAGVADFLEFWNNHYQKEGLNLFVITQRNNEFAEYFDEVIKYSLKDDHTVQV